MELFYCDQCEIRIANAEVADARAQAEAFGGKILCGNCRPKAVAVRPATAEMKLPPRSTVRIPRKTPVSDAGSKRVPMFGGAAAPMPSLPVAAPPPPLPPLPLPAMPPRHFSPPRGQDAHSTASTASTASAGSGSRPATAVRPFRASISNRGAPAVRLPEATALRGSTRRNMPMLIGIYVAGVCLLGLAVTLIWPGKKPDSNKTASVSENEQKTPAPSPPPPPPAHLSGPAATTDPKLPDKPPSNYSISTPPAPATRTPAPRPPPPPPPTVITRPAPKPEPKAEVRAELPEHHVAALQGAPPKIDGIIDDVAWREAVSIDMNKLTDGKPSKGTARAAILHDDKNLYISVQCFEDAKALTSLKADATQDHPDNAWADDSVEIFIDPANSRQSYYQIAVNSKGVHWEAFLPKPSKPDTTWTPKINVAANVGKVSWTIELSIPLAEFDRTAVGAEWAFNIVHTRIAADELLMWSPLYDSSNHVPARFGRLLGMPTK